MRLFAYDIVSEEFSLEKMRKKLLADRFGSGGECLYKTLAVMKRLAYLPSLQAECIGRSSVRRREESPDSAGQDVLLLKQEHRCQIAGDGKCRRK